MMRRITRRSFMASAAAGASLGLGANVVRAQDYPNRPVRFIVPLAPGGAIDFVARQVGDVLSRNLGQQIVVENRTGAGGTVGMDAALKSPPDGYTVLITNDNAASAPHIMHLSYNYTKELLPVCYLGRQPQILAAHTSLGVTTLQELVAYVKANPGVGVATSGVGSNQHVLAEWFKREAKIKLDHVPYRGAGQAINDLIAGHVKTAILGPTSMMPHYQAGTIKLLAASSAKRAPTLPEIPTFEESGFKGVVLEAWYAAFAPPGTPAPIIDKLNAEMNTALKDPKLLENFSAGALEAVGGRPDVIGTLARADSAKYAQLAEELNIRVN
jgi:tripartite-type tricarboxylate transporter receptor subunit TctC